MLCTSVDLRLDTGFVDVLFDFLDQMMHIFIPHTFPQSDLFYQIIIGFRL